MPMLSCYLSFKKSVLKVFPAVCLCSGGIRNIVHVCLGWVNTEQTVNFPMVFPLIYFAYHAVFKGNFTELAE